MINKIKLKFEKAKASGFLIVIKCEGKWWKEDERREFNWDVGSLKIGNTIPDIIYEEFEKIVCPDCKSRIKAAVGNCDIELHCKYGRPNKKWYKCRNFERRMKYESES